MRRVASFVVVLCGFVLGACAGEPETPPQKGWPKVECPQGSGVLAEARLLQIEAWAGAGTPAKVKAEQCRTAHTGVNEIHCAKVYTAWSAASAAQNALLSPEQKAVLMAFCASELTHDGDGGGVASAAGAGIWPDVECMPMSGISARQRLNDIIGWATTANRLDAKSKAEQCILHPTDSLLHRVKVYSAWESASASRNPLLTEPESQALWLLCVSELTHDGDGSGVGG